MNDADARATWLASKRYFPIYKPTPAVSRPDSGIALLETCICQRKSCRLITWKFVLSNPTLKILQYLKCQPGLQFNESCYFRYFTLLGAVLRQIYFFIWQDASPAVTVKISQRKCIFKCISGVWSPQPISKPQSTLTCRTETPQFLK